MIMFKQNSLSSLSDSQLIQRLDNLVKKERQTTLDVLTHLIEMDRRRLYLGRGYASLYEYCTRHLGYSESAAFRRIKTARCIRDFPEIYEMLLKNELNLTTVSKLAGILTEENKDAMLKDARFKSTRQVEAIAARYNPRSVIHDRVRTVFIKTCLQTPVVENESKMSGSGNISMRTSDSNEKKSTRENWVNFTSGAGGKKLAAGCDTQKREPVLEQKFKLEFTVDPAFMKKLEEARAILSKKYPRGVSFEQLFEIALDEFLEKHSPERKIQRRENRKSNEKMRQKKTSATKETKNAKTPTPRSKNHKLRSMKRSRHIPEAVQDEVYARDKNRCTYKSPGGIRCNSSWNLQIDHIEPFARGGEHKIQNLRLLCERHNKLEAKRIYGREFMDQQVNESGPMRE